MNLIFFRGCKSFKQFYRSFPKFQKIYHEFFFTISKMNSENVSECQKCFRMSKMFDEMKKCAMFLECSLNLKCVQEFEKCL